MKQTCRMCFTSVSTKTAKSRLPCSRARSALGTDAELFDFFDNDERIRATIEKDITKNTEEALLEIYRRLRPGEPLTVENSQQYLESLLFDERRYDLSRVGRYKYNKKLSLSNRLAGHKLSRPIVSPLTGEVVAEGPASSSTAKERPKSNPPA